MLRQQSIVFRNYSALRVTSTLPEMSFVWFKPPPELLWNWRSPLKGGETRGSRVVINWYELSLRCKHQDRTHLETRNTLFS